MGIFKTKHADAPVGPPITFIPVKPIGQPMAMELYAQLQILMANAINARAEIMLLTLTGQGLRVQLQIDGVMHDREVFDPNAGLALMNHFKMLSWIDYTQRVPRQDGSLKVKYRTEKFSCEVINQLGQNMERLLFKITGKYTSPPERLDEAGMNPLTFTKLKEFMFDPVFVLVSGIPKGGFTTTFNCTVGSVDRYLKNAAVVEDVNSTEPPISNVSVTTYDAKAEQTPADVLPGLIRTYPDVIAVRNVTNAATVDLLSAQPKQDRNVIAGIPAKDAVEALVRVLALRPDADKFISTVGAVVNSRVVRKLCSECKDAYAPPPQLMQQLGIPRGRVASLYRPAPPKLPPDVRQKMIDGQIPIVCTACQGIGYRGRTGLFEVLMVTDDLRKAMRKTNKVDELRKVAQKTGFRPFLEEGVMLASRGVTSIQEVLRVLKSG